MQDILRNFSSCLLFLYSYILLRYTERNIGFRKIDIFFFGDYLLLLSLNQWDIWWTDSQTASEILLGSELFLADTCVNRDNHRNDTANRNVTMELPALS